MHVRAARYKPLNAANELELRFTAFATELPYLSLFPDAGSPFDPGNGADIAPIGTISERSLLARR